MSLTNLCSCTLMKDHKMRQIINDIYLLFLRIMTLASLFFKNNYFDLFFKNLRLCPLSPFRSHLSISDFHFHFLSIWGDGGHPPPPHLPVPPPPPRHFRPRTRASPLFITIPPPPPFHQILGYRVTIWHFDRKPE